MVLQSPNLNNHIFRDLFAKFRRFCPFFENWLTFAIDLVSYDNEAAQNTV